jgi:SAM-dependent methyltransferase
MKKQFSMQTSPYTSTILGDMQIGQKNEIGSSVSSRLYKTTSRWWHKVPAGIRQPIWGFIQSFSGQGYQRIRFHGKTYVQGIDRSRSYQQLFPEPPAGKSILDVGGDTGYYSLMATQEGAKYCRSLDRNKAETDKLKEVAADLDIHNIDAIQADIFNYEIERDFDIVLALNLIHHFDTIERVEKILDKLYQRALEKFILVVLAPGDTKTLFSIDKEPDVMGGKRFVRISPLFFMKKYGREKVKVTQALTYGPSRYAIFISKK